MPLDETTLRTPPGVAVAVGISLQVDLGEGRSVVLQTHYAGDLGLAERAALQDRLYDDADRLKARARITAIDKDIASLGIELALGEEQLARARETYETKGRARQEEMDRITQADYEAATKNNRRGEYAPSAACRASLEKVAQEGLSAANEKTMTERNYEASAAMIHRRIRDLNAERLRLVFEVSAPYKPATGGVDDAALVSATG